MDNILSINLNTPNEIMMQVARSFKERRLAMSLTQEGLANRSGVSFGSVKRFETTGKISFESILKIALVLGALGEFEKITKIRNNLAHKSLDDILTEGKKSRSRGVLK